LEMTPDRTDLSVNGWNAEYVDGLYQRWQADPDSVEPEWRQFFAGFDLGYRPTLGADVVQRALPAAPSTTGVPATKQSKVDTLIYHYRDIGHWAADLDPLGTRRPFPED